MPPTSTYGITDMAGPADHRIPLLSATRIEVGRMRTDPEGAKRRVALQAVPLRVTRCTGLQTAARGTTVAQQPERLGVVEDRAREPPARRLSRIRVTFATEHTLVVTVRALEPAGIGRRRMPEHEIVRMESRAVRGFVTRLAEGCRVTARAPVGVRGGVRAVIDRERRRRVRHGQPALCGHALCPRR